MLNTPKDPPAHNPLLCSVPSSSSDTSSPKETTSMEEIKSNVAISSSSSAINPMFAYNKFMMSNFFPMNSVPYTVYPGNNLSAFSAPMSSQPFDNDPIAALAPLTAAVSSNGYGYAYNGDNQPADDKQNKKKRKKTTTSGEQTDTQDNSVEGGIAPKVTKAKKPKAVADGDDSQGAPAKPKRKKKADDKDSRDGLQILCAAIGIQQPPGSKEGVEVSTEAMEGSTEDPAKAKRPKMKHPKIQASISNKLEVDALEEQKGIAAREFQRKADTTEPRKVVGIAPDNDFHDDLAVGMTEEYIPSEPANALNAQLSSQASVPKNLNKISFPSTDTFDSSYVRKLKIHENGDLIEPAALYKLFSQESSQEKTLKLLLPNKASFDDNAFSKITMIEEHRKVIPFVFDGVLDGNIECLHERVISPLKYWEYLKSIIDASSPIAKCLKSDHVESTILHIDSCSEADFEHAYMGENVVKWNSELLLYQKGDFQDEKSYHNFLLIMRTFRSCFVILRKKLLDQRCFIPHNEFGKLMKEVIEDVISEKKRVKRNDIYHAVRESYHLLHGISNTMMAAFLLKLPKSTKCLVLRCCKWLLLTGHTITFGGGGSIFSKIVDRLLEKITKH